MLDATKAFDRVEYCKLVRLLVCRDLPSAWLRLLLNVYTKSSTRIAWNGICSAMFLVENGVKQGGPNTVLYLLGWLAYFVLTY